MDALGERIIRDKAAAAEKRKLADELEKQVVALRQEAHEIERLLEQARHSR